MIDTVRIAIFAALQDRKGISSLEYIVLAVAIIGIVSLAFSSSGTLGTAVTDALAAIAKKMALT